MKINIHGAIYDKTRTQIFSSGGGVQSTAIAVLIFMGKLEKPDLSVIVDTEREKCGTWEYLDSITNPALSNIGIEIQRVLKSKYATVDVFSGKNKNSILIPAYTSMSGKRGKLPGYCSTEWKRRVMQRWVIKEHGVKKAQVWMGFSMDEIKRATRMLTLTPGKWGVRFPLIEMGMDRQDCLETVRQVGWPMPPRSSCWMCPNMHMREWREVMLGPDRGKVIAFEKEIREHDKHVWLTDQCCPIEQADFSERNALLWGDSGAECESGQCFV